jgi:hypothetical protein
MFESEEQTGQEPGTPAEGGGEGAPSDPPSPTSPPDNPPTDEESVQKGLENLEKIAGN